MRYLRLSLFAAGLALLAGAGVAWSCGKYGLHFTGATESIRIALPADVNLGVVRDDHLFAVTRDGALIDVDLKQQKVRTFGEIKQKLGAVLDVRGGKACLVADNKDVQILDLASGKVERTIDAKAAVRGVGFAGADRMFIQNAKGFDVLDLATGETVARIGGKDNQVFRFVTRSADSDATGKQVYASVSGDKHGLAVVDAETGKVREVIPMPSGDGFSGDVRLIGDKVIVVGLRFGYGMWTNHLGYVDLKTRKYNALKLPSNVMRESGLIPGPDGSFFLTGPDGTFRYGADGILMGRVQLDSRLLGFWNGRAVIGGSSVQVVPMPEVTTAKVK